LACRPVIDLQQLFPSTMSTMNIMNIMSIMSIMSTMSIAIRVEISNIVTITRTALTVPATRLHLWAPCALFKSTRQALVLILTLAFGSRERFFYTGQILAVTVAMTQTALAKANAVTPELAEIDF